MLITFAISAAVFILDMVTKYAVADNIELYKSIDVIPGVLKITNIPNDGIAFGMLDNARWLFMLVTSVLVVCLAAFAVICKNYHKTVYICAGLILGGGIGNLVDRIFALGRYDLPKNVVDFIDFCAFSVWKWSFNAADASVCIGVGLFLIYLVFFDKKAEQKGYKAILAEKKNGEKPKE